MTRYRRNHKAWRGVAIRFCEAIAECCKLAAMISWTLKLKQHSPSEPSAIATSSLNHQSPTSPTLVRFQPPLTILKTWAGNRGPIHSSRVTRGTPQSVHRAPPLVRYLDTRHETRGLGRARVSLTSIPSARPDTFRIVQGPCIPV